MLQLVLMTDSEFLEYSRHVVEEVAQEHVRVDNWPVSEALQKAEKEFQQLLPEGVYSKNQTLYSIKDDQADLTIGMIWFAVRGQAPRLSAFIYDFRIDEQFRNRGYGKQTLSALDEKVKELGIDTISLHVFGHNQTAIAVYQKAGYEITNLYMEKKLSI
jgi:ribosomal protein S18 acetylase RimI-like enzyme